MLKIFISTYIFNGMCCST